uniref:BTB domain-containing protein n=1 Tax=Chaetoceros debilis TaxID=122233 RepID=A0A7S3PZ28_9STRA|mmetsp:Transcript_29501/g.45030  ORF Transcript_29501/g.45030 Transcript_29501/m.45030 type:complete len:530 (-) Transcript_29501:135-1724(-)|eukprot:CAMPEP_0194078444 /NCGR_PEP_ID=MMETSP0149-20130528/4843_1 /TAXON_ID=122233 /ORGANISM="Chaetoceros debilis, Strain MM31A-1" /LENGTH=529 /DNA_ID=CAMNT_0038759715 /DNA_START=167 /DNA_END=1756 /DNA_ORIENTATION=-
MVQNRGRVRQKYGNSHDDRRRSSNARASNSRDRYRVTEIAKSSSSNDSSNSNLSSDLFREAEDFIKDKMNTLLDDENQAFLRDKMNNLLGLGYTCAATTKQTVKKAFSDDDDVYNDDSEHDIDEGVKVNWRMDPRQSMSDWTLVVRELQDPVNSQTQMFHVHKAVICFGDRRSGFFEKKCQHHSRDIGGGHSQKNNITEVQVDSYAIIFIPMLLDFIYFDKLNLDPESAPGLRILASQFNVKQLFALVSSFIQNDLTERTVVAYMNEADLARDKELLEVAMDMAVQCFDLIPDDALGNIPPQIMQKMMIHPQVFCPSSERLSHRIATYIRGRQEGINDELFFFLTHANILPIIDPEEAIWYLTFGAAKFMSVLIDESMGGYDASLKRRCIVAACMDWKGILIGPVNSSARSRRENQPEENEGNSSPTGRRRLFHDEGDHSTSVKDNAYLTLPDNIRVEILEEALLKASEDRHNHDGNVKTQNTYPVRGATRSHNEYYGEKADQTSVDYRSDVGMRDTLKTMREVSDSQR